ncbi:MAG: ABC transporter ATP-binding protein [Candidatus Buchananbacteria bacterium]|nr:ABC transporter ATP-binding protein [Candidatus Buchananbacteria bacterium]
MATLALKDNRVLKLIKLSKKAYADFKWQIVLLTFFGFVGGVLEGIGINALVPLFSFSLGLGEGQDDIISKTIKNIFEFFGINFSVKYLLVLIIILFILKALVTVFLEYLRLYITSDYEVRTRSRLFEKIIKANWPYHIKQRAGNLETILLIDVPASGGLLSQISSTIIICTSLIVYVFVAVNISLVITLITLVVGAIMFLVLKPLIYKTKIFAGQRVNLNKDIAHHIGENIQGIKTVKSMVASTAVWSKGVLLFEELKRLTIKLGILKSFNASLIQPVGVIFVSLLFAFTYQSETFNLAMLIAIVYLIQQIFVYVQQLQRTLQSMNEFLPHLNTVIQYQDLADKNIEADQGSKNFSFESELVFSQVGFSYNKEKQILKNVNLNIKKGEMLGLIGPSGVGKTTLVDLVLRLLPLQQGAITIDGGSINDIKLDEWRKNIGYVSQDIFLVNATIADNIRFYDNQVTQDQIISAAKMANIYDFIDGLPEKFNTMVGDRGLMLSAGQRQRLVIARILARNPQILILDEATSALDNESEAQIQSVIRNLKGKITVLAIAHRLSTIMDSDRLVVLDAGNIVEEGVPGDLLKQKDSYLFKVYNIRNNN